MELAGRRVVVVGLGASGSAAASLCAARGADVVGVDSRDTIEPIEGVRLELGPHRRETFLAAELLVVSPGVPGNQVDVQAAEAAGVPVIGELGLAASLLPDRPVVGITGTNGKSSVTSFCGQLLAAAGMRPFVGGNLGDPLCNAVPRVEGQEVDWDVAVVECSSYQLERAGPFRPHAAALLNLTPDHLARHGTMEGYAAAKARLLRVQQPGDLAFIADDPRLDAAVEGAGQGTRVRIGGLPGVRVDGEVARIVLPRADGPLEATLDLSGLPMPGAHNRRNAAIAAALALFVGAPAGAVQAAIPSLRALPHRMEPVTTRGDVLWIDDSKATNVAATLVAVSGLSRPAVVLLGGQAKEGDDFTELVPWLGRHRAVVTFGGAGPMIADTLEGAGVSCVRASTMADAVQRAAHLARPGDAVLLSPGGSSFDAFDNFAQRGRIFHDLALEVRP